MNVKNIGMISLLAFSLAACSRVEAGNVGVKVNLLGDTKGVSQEVLGPGRYWIGMNEELYVFPTFTQNYTWDAEASRSSPNDESISFGTVEGMNVNADVGISYHIDPDKVPLVFQKYRKGIDEITNIYLRNMVRDSLVRVASTKPIDSVYGAGKADIIDAVQKDVSEQVASIGIVIEKIYWIGSLRLPETVVAALNAKQAATQISQQRENEVATARAEAQKKIEEARGNAESIRLEAQAQAEANRILAQSLTSELVQYTALQKWNGSLPTTMAGNGSIPFINVGK